MPVGLPIETSRLLLRPKTLDDLPFMYRLLSDPAVMRYVGDRRPRSLQQVREGLQAQLDHQRAHGFSLWLALERASGEPVGDCGLVHLEDGPEVEVGYRFAPQAWGRGYATEAASASLAYGFDVIGLEQIVAVAYPENAASRRVMEKVGMSYGGRGVYYGVDAVRYVARRVPEEPVELADYDPGWPARFAKEQAGIAQALGDLAEAVEHVGSTAVAGLAAKPIVDILVGLRAYPLAEAGVAALAELGYAHHGEAGIPGRQFFRRGQPPTHHVHATLHGSELWRSYRAFRDHLRAHSHDAARYERLKRELAARHGDDRARYSEAKGALIEEILVRALAS